MARDQRDTWCQMTRSYGGDIGLIPCRAHKCTEDYGGSRTMLSMYAVVLRGFIVN